MTEPGIQLDLVWSLHLYAEICSLIGNIKSTCKENNKPYIQSGLTYCSLETTLPGITEVKVT